MKADEKVDLFAARLRRVFERLTSIDTCFSETYLTFQLLRYLPTKFDSVVQSILRFPDADFTFEKVLLELVAEETRLDLRREDLNNQYPEVNLAARRPRRQKTSSSKERVCYKCGNPGHFKAQCPVKKEGQPNRTYSNSSRGSTTGRRWRNKPKADSSFRQKDTPEPDFAKRADVKSKCSSQFLLQANVSETEGDDLTWVFDTAATHHFCRNRDLFTDFIPLKEEEMAVAVQGVKFPIEGKGNVKLKFGQRIICLDNVMFSPNLRKNLISGPKFDQANATFQGGNGEVRMSDQHGLIFKAVLKDNIYYVKPKIPSISIKHVSFETSSTKVENLNAWHKRLAHVSAEVIKQTSKSCGVKGLPTFKNIDLHCENCKLNKFRRVSFKPCNRIRSKRPLELLYADVWGPCKIEGRKGERYFISIIDDYSRRVAVYPIREKSEVPEILKRHINRAERFIGYKVKAIRSDNGTEFVNKNLDSFCNQLGIKHELTNVYTPEQNGVPERFNQTILDCVRTILCESGLDKSFWPEAMLYFTYTWNRVCHKDQEKTPFELYGGAKPSVRHLKPFGSIAYTGIPRQNRGKLDAKARKGVLVGYAFRTKGYRVWIPESDKIIETINIAFKEDSFYKSQNLEKRSGAVLGTQEWSPSTHSGESDSNEDVADEEASAERTPDVSTSDEEFSDSEVERPTTFPKRDAVWIRKTVPRPDGSRTDVYYYEKGHTQRLRSTYDAIKYCEKNCIVYEPHIFNFKGKWTFQGELSSQSTSKDGCNFSEL
jgi:transposase InsO family protein